MIGYKRKVLFVYLPILLFLWGMAACDTQEGEPVFLGKEYFGFQQGNYLIYEVDSTVYDDFLGEVFHYQYQVKEILKEIYTDVQGNEKMRLERFWRENSQQPWKVKNIWTSRITDMQAIRTEENMTFVKLAFPVKNFKQWNGNAYNNLQEQHYQLHDVHNAAALGDMEFDSTLRVMQKDFETLISKDFQYEMYAINVGMIKKVYIALDKDIDGTIVRGVDYSYTIIEYGSLNI